MSQRGRRASGNLNTADRTCLTGQDWQSLLSKQCTVKIAEVGRLCNAAKTLPLTGLPRRHVRKALARSWMNFAVRQIGFGPP